MGLVEGSTAFPDTGLVVLSPAVGASMSSVALVLNAGVVEATGFALEAPLVWRRAAPAVSVGEPVGETVGDQVSLGEPRSARASGSAPVHQPPHEVK